MSTTKTVTKFFLLPDYEKEEAYLSQMHQNGWKLVKINLWRYTFEKCEPANVTYRLDFAANKTDKEAYANMFRDYGWEYIQDVNDFSYFRKNSDGLAPEELEIFSDNESRLAMIRNIVTTKMAPILPILCLTTYLLTMHFDSIIVGCLFGLIALLYLGVLIHCIAGFNKLKKKYGQK